MAECFQNLESNDPQQVEGAKQTFRLQFNQLKEPWLLNSIYDLYLKNNSVRYMEVLVNVMEPHHIFLFDKLMDSIHGNKNDEKVQALTLLGHVVRQQTTWLFKITEHKLLKELMRLLKAETDILPLVSALLVLIILLPIIPSYIGQYCLDDVFEIFSRLAAWNCNNPEKLVEEQMIHMQVALYALFQRLYGMYPCNFLAYLRKEYRNKDLSPIFSHTIKPMIGTVKMHPLLVTISKDNEITTERWKRMNAHDVIVDCESFTLGIIDRCVHENCFATSSFRSRSGTTNSATYDASYQLHSLKNMPMSSLATEGSPSIFFQLSSQTPVNDSTSAKAILHTQGSGPNLITLATMRVHSQEGTSPPEAAIEATPETTPIKDLRLSSNRQSLPPSQVPRALTSFNPKTRSLGSASTTPSHSQPSSPMRKDLPPFVYPTGGDLGNISRPLTQSYGLGNKVQKLLLERSQVIDSDQFSTGRSTKSIIPPISPFRNIENSNLSAISLPMNQRIESPVSQEDEEVVAIVGDGNHGRHHFIRQCDSVIHDVDGRVTEEELHECELEQGSPCTVGGLHMVDSTVITTYVERLRYHSQCASGNESYECLEYCNTGNVVPLSASSSSCNKVRRANSCPEIKKLPPTTSTKEQLDRTLDETDEDTTNASSDEKNLSNGVLSKQEKEQKPKKLTTSETQTENFWPMPYEHLFLSIFPSAVECNDLKAAQQSSQASSPQPLQQQQQPQFQSAASTSDIIEKYIEVAMNTNEKNVKNQLQLLNQQLLFERQRRESHACINRKLLADGRKIRALEEHNSALRDQIQLQQKDFDKLRDQNVSLNKHVFPYSKCMDDVNYYKTICANLQLEMAQLKETNADLVRQLDIERETSNDLEKKWKSAEEKLFHAESEVKISQDQILVGQKCRMELDQVNRDLLLCGELVEKYRERLGELPLQKKSDLELARLSKVYEHEVKTLQQQLELKCASLEAYRTRITELEMSFIQNDESSSIQKRSLNHVQDECHEKVKAVESKYQTILAVNRSLEEKILELWQQIEVASKRPVHSPDTSSCHEVNVTYTDRTSGATAGLSPHSSPLSASLASSEGSVAFLHSDVREMKNLQMIVDQVEPLPPVHQTSVDDVLTEAGTVSTSSQHPNTTSTTSKYD